MNRCVKLVVAGLFLFISSGCNHTKDANIMLTGACDQNDASSKMSCETTSKIEEEIEFTISSEPFIEFLDPPFSNRTLEKIDFEWTENDVDTAWHMTEASNVYNEYTDRLFCDIDKDLSYELLLTSYTTQNMYFFKKVDNKIEMLCELIDMDITNGYMIIPPTDKEIIQQYEVYDYQNYHNFKLYNKGGSLYVSGISFRSAVGKTCWIKKLIASEEDIAFYDVFRWGMFTKNERIASDFEYRKYDCSENYTNSSQQEINDFLDYVQEFETFFDSEYENSKEVFAFQSTNISTTGSSESTTESLTNGTTESITENSTVESVDSYSDVESNVSENKTGFEYEDTVQKCISYVRNRNPLEVIDKASYDIDNEGY